MADGAAPFQSTRDRHAMGDFREHLVVDPQPTATKSPRLSAYYHKNKFVIEIKTNVPADMNGRERGIVRAELDPHVFYTFIDAFEKLIQENKPSYAKRIRIKRPDFQKTNGGEPVTDAQLVFGRDKDGVAYIAVLPWNKERPAIQFIFHPGRWLEFVNNDGTPLTPAEVSTDLAIGRLREWSQLAAHYMYNRFVPEEFTPRGAGNQPNGGGDMRTEQKADPTQASWDNLPF
jgi:hypothetical protein